VNRRHPQIRFVLLSSPPVIQRMDTAPGETWTLKEEKCTSVQDILIVSGKYNSETNKIEWGTKAGRSRASAALEGGVDSDR
jgi:hypothetical protein